MHKGVMIAALVGAWLSVPGVGQAAAINIVAGAPWQTTPDDTATTVLSFDNATAGSLASGYNFAGGTLTGDGLIVNGSTSLYASPAGDVSNYLSAGGQQAVGSTTLTTSSPENYLGLYWGSIDSYNSVTFLRDGLAFATYTGSDIADILGLNANGDQGAADANRYINFYTNDNFYDQVIFGTTNYAFEFDDVAFGDPPSPIPEPASLPLVAVALLALGLVWQKRNPRQYGRITVRV